jgi:hypothetical protein
MRTEMWNSWIITSYRFLEGWRIALWTTSEDQENTGYGVLLSNITKARGIKWLRDNTLHVHSRRWTLASTKLSPLVLNFLAIREHYRDISPTTRPYTNSYYVSQAALLSQHEIAASAQGPMCPLVTTLYVSRRPYPHSPFNLSTMSLCSLTSAHDRVGHMYDCETSAKPANPGSATT